MINSIVISLCDLTGNIAKIWAENGYICYCVDIAHSIRKDKIIEFKSGGKLIYTWGDIRSWIPPENQKIKIVLAAPPCTDLSISGARDFEKKAGYRLSDALELFDACELAGRYSGAPYMIENPISRLSSHKRKPEFTFQPFHYGGYLNPIGDQYSKLTCIWCGNGFKIPERREVECTEGSKMHLMPPSEDRASLRSETPLGFATAIYLANKD